MSNVIALCKDFQEENLWNLSEVSSSSFVPVVQAVTVGLISTSESGSTSAKLHNCHNYGISRNSGPVSQVDSTSFDAWMDLEAMSAGLCSVGMYRHCFGFENCLILCTLLWT